MPKDEIVRWLKEEIENADEEFKSSHKIDPNCYGAGYDRGYLDALITARTFINALDEQ